ncbi:DUF3392 domain-containing protein [Photobacterium galatheae]|uniref:Membrane protein n=1 Tax=Photobacterium galatheae TaxID=1654360 RepID=A0A066RRK8_9GAMM|nr:DUF3392 domain-containing protein [Photobacterium galatheae]KDM91726.1 membrane protein [Photobacterium galatheae]MCM0149837.1 DUF3392 domain-containing protein [Photobacterium galatheae]
MDTVLHYLAESGQWMRPWISDISMAMMACLLVVFGSDINMILRRYLSGTNFLIRTCAFIFVNAFGYGLLIVAVSPWLATKLTGLSNLWLLTVVLGTFVLLGTWAQRNNQV